PVAARRPGCDGAGLMADGVVLLLGSGVQPWREYALAGAAERHPLWLMDQHEPGWQHRYVTGGSALNPFDPKAVLRAAQAVDFIRGVRGLLCWDERLIETAAEVAAGLGLPGLSARSVRACRDKGFSRQLLTAAGLRQPRSVPVSSAAAAREVAAEFGYPVVIKPRNLGGS